MTDAEIMRAASLMFEQAQTAEAPNPYETLQAQLALWQEQNFGKQPIERMVLGAAEEVGELAHATLKGLQGIRGMDDEAVRVKGGDSIADATIYLMQAATALRLDFWTLIRLTATKVLSRNWKAAPANGGEGTSG